MTGQIFILQAARIFWENQTPVMRGIILMCLSTIAFSIMHGLVRFVSMSHIQINLLSYSLSYANICFVHNTFESSTDIGRHYCFCIFHWN